MREPYWKPCVHSVQPCDGVAALDGEHRRAVGRFPGPLQRVEANRGTLPHPLNRLLEVVRGQGFVNLKHASCRGFVVLRMIVTRILADAPVGCQ